MVAGYYRFPEEASDGGRSYWITLKETQSDTQDMDVKDWIVFNKLNLLYDDLGGTEELQIETFNLDNKNAYRIVSSTDNGVPKRESIYFQTSKGIRGIGFRSWSSGDTLVKDYNSFKKVLMNFKFL